jgi:hypothetical protein
MLSIKYISTSGHEEVFSSSHVSYEPPTETEIGCVCVERPDESMRTVCEGYVYVMNEKGSTVASYALTDKKKAPDKTIRS